MPRLQRSMTFVLALAPLLLVGCRSAASGRDFPGLRAGGRSVRIAVENSHFLDVTVYAMADAGSSFRLGQVTGKSAAQFTMERWKLRGHPGIRIFVDPLGGARGFLSQLVFPDRAASVFVHVAQTLELSYVVLR